MQNDSPLKRSLKKYNHEHDEKGQFAAGDGGAPGGVAKPKGPGKDDEGGREFYAQASRQAAIDHNDAGPVGPDEAPFRGNAHLKDRADMFRRDDEAKAMKERHAREAEDHKKLDLSLRQQGQARHHRERLNAGLDYDYKPQHGAHEAQRAVDKDQAERERIRGQLRQNQLQERNAQKAIYDRKEAELNANGAGAVEYEKLRRAREWDANGMAERHAKENEKHIKAARDAAKPGHKLNPNYDPFGGQEHPAAAQIRGQRIENERNGRLLHQHADKMKPQADKKVKPVLSFHDDDYQRSHGKRPKGNGLWAFNVHTDNGEPERFEHNGNYADAKNAAILHGKKVGARLVQTLG